jgi:hypothetical protein
MEAPENDIARIWQTVGQKRVWKTEEKTGKSLIRAFVTCYQFYGPGV